ncbi:hypothetical protein ERO13_A02G005100v2 [Gossypium hirsutum]|uniref:Plant bHLH transcription factor ACT-like domain-containing protein n=4 Tax=Gossypium TaxID=3633 RepID=A0ABR0QQQ1_GOSAR|nr:transcription factor SCREAM2-like [Gossypium hirsutum]XP_052882366.1 transcription factor SCREAM2-like [Gossypium arboreum]KAB2092093.1 hypothetical protein ES319_A02G005400v1 [Gossypium barbadense]TYI38149.1 hypothetical protein ES332_A02G005600v1 [Gossypium tomentosum]KAG4209810.1 hypothetical protein ERO13_A02G005100v2 [Gossypium hirsutum]KAK5841308.1 hypothetical protein PVK06_010218 [Gossypium arboreum]
MSSKAGRKKASSSSSSSSVHEQLQQLRSLTNSAAVNKTSIIVDASRYIEELKDKVDKMNQETATSSQASTSSQNPLPMVTVETLEKGFLINVFLQKNCPGLLVSILETFEELGLDVLEARVSCEESFKLEAIGGENEGNVECIDAQMVKQAVMQAIRKWGENSHQE